MGNESPEPLTVCADAAPRVRVGDRLVDEVVVMSQQAAPALERRRLGGGAIASLSGLAVLAIFVVQNTQEIRFQFLFLEFTWPLWLYTIVVAVFGAVVWLGLGVMRRHRRRKARRAERRG